MTGTPTTSAGTCTATGNDVDCDLASLPATAGSNTWTIAIPVQVAATTTESVPENTATVSTTSGDPVPGNNSDTESTAIDVLPSITVLKTANDNSVPETGQSVTFTFRVTNNTAEPVTITSLDDTDFTITGDSDCQVGTVLAGNAFCEFTHSATISGDFGGPDHVNTFTAKAEDDEENEATDDESETVTFTDVLPDVTVTKTADPISVFETGAMVEFTVTITNNSTEAGTIDSLVDSDFTATCLDDAAGVVLDPAGGANDSYTCVFTRTVSGDFAGPDHSNTVTTTVSDDDGNSDVEEATETVTFTDVLPSITVLKTANDNSVPETGQSVTFTFRVTNNTAEPVTITSLDDTDFTITGDSDCQVGTVLAGNAFCEFTHSATISGDFGGPDHVNTFTAKAEDDEENEATDDESETVTFTDVLPDVTVTKTADPISVFETGAMVEFTVTITNNSTEAGTIDSLVDSDFTATCLDDAAGVVLDPAGGANDSYTCVFTRRSSVTSPAPITATP